MAYNQTEYGRDQLLGNTELPLLSTPTLRGSVRRHDPDADHAYAYVPGLTGKTLLVEVSKAPSLDPPVSLTFTFSAGVLPHADSLAEALAYINSSQSDLLASEAVGGYLQLESAHGGYTNYIKITGGTAAPLFGLPVDPFPGAISYAGELDSTPPVIGQDNPQGTKLVGRDEDLNSSVINRAIWGATQELQRLLTELDRSLLGVLEYTDVTVTTTSGGVYYFTLDDDENLLPVKDVPRLLDLVNLLSSTGEELIPIGGGGAQDGSKVAVDGVFYGPPPFSGSHFVAWGTPDGGTVFDGGSGAAYQQAKGVTATIASIRGNVVTTEDPAVDFLAIKLRPGDTVKIQNAGNHHPFDHNGEFVVEKVLAAKTVMLRPKSRYEDLVWPDSARPTSLNASSGGALGEMVFPLGFFLPISQLSFRLTQAVTPAANYRVRLVTMRRLRDIGSQQLNQPLSNNQNALGKQFRTHVDELEPGTLHHANKVTTAALPAWYGHGADIIPAGRVQDALEGILNSLNTTAGGPVSRAGSDRIGSPEISVSGPRTIIAGSVRLALYQLLQFYTNHINTGLADRHRALDVDKTLAGPNFVDGTSLGAGTVQAIFDGIVTNLAANTLLTHDGAAKIGAAANSGASPKTLAQGSVRNQLDELLGHINNHLSGSVGFRHPATAIDTAARGGSPYSMGASAAQAYLDYLLDGLNDLNGRAALKAVSNYFTATQYLRELRTQGYGIYSQGGVIDSGGGNIGSGGGAILSSGGNHHSNGGGYYSSGGIFDASGGGGSGRFYSSYSPGYSTGLAAGNFCLKNACKAWGSIWVNDSDPYVGIENGFNIASVTKVWDGGGTTIDWIYVTFAQALPYDQYAVLFGINQRGTGNPQYWPQTGHPGSTYFTGRGTTSVYIGLVNGSTGSRVPFSQYYGWLYFGIF